MMKRNIKTALFALLFLTIAACQRYEDGGLISKAEKRLTESTWKLSKYLRNGTDETSDLVISNFTETFSSNGDLTRSYTDKDGNPFSETGSWQFDNDKQQINLTGVGSIEFTNETSTVSSSDYNMLRLKGDELWYTYDNGGDTHELRFIPN